MPQRSSGGKSLLAIVSEAEREVVQWPLAAAAAAAGGVRGSREGGELSA